MDIYMAVFAVFGIVAGAKWLAHASQAFREEEISNTPISRCDAAAVGKVAMSGIAHAEKLSPALFSGSKSIFCRCKISKWISAGRWSYWKEAATITFPPHPYFTLTDGSGDVVVLAENAELRLGPTVFFKCGKMGNSLFEDVFALDDRPDVVMQSGLAVLEQYGSLDRNRYLIEETRIREGAQLYIYGVAMESAMLPKTIEPRADALPKNRLVIWEGTKKSDFLITNQVPQNLVSGMNNLVTLGMFGGPLIIAFGVAVLAWLSFAPPFP
jgi:hypothetical protein